MGLQWQLVAGLLYLEVAFVFLLCTGLISPARWKRIFTSRFVMKLKAVAPTSFYALLIVLIILFADSVNKMFKHRAHIQAGKGAPMPGVMGVDHGAQMFLAQRNIYITGFSLFLLFVVNFLVKLLSELATATAREEAALQQAKSASTQAEKVMKENENLQKSRSTKSAGASVQDSTELVELRQQYDDKCKELDSAKASLAAIKSQAESTNREYDRLLKEHSRLQDQVSTGSKKSD